MRALADEYDRDQGGSAPGLIGTRVVKYRDRENGKIERFHQSLRREFLADRTFPSIEAAQAALDAW